MICLWCGNPPRYITVWGCIQMHLHQANLCPKCYQSLQKLRQCNCGEPHLEGYMSFITDYHPTPVYTIPFPL